VTVALLVAAGSGERLGAGGPKAFVAVAGRPLLDWSLDAIRAAGIKHVVVALPAAFLTVFGDDAVALVEGGATRSASVRNALAAAPASSSVVVHDAARPLAPPELFTRCVAALADADCAIAAARVADTIKEADGVRVTGTLDRSRLWAVQTPQAFRRDALERALDVSDDVLGQATDDAWLVERAGGSVVVVEATEPNLKVTTPADLAIAEALLRERARPSNSQKR
jgi:2-C-methyl-D-erythritol 4-phosphate cytidylyltransferase